MIAAPRRTEPLVVMPTDAQIAAMDDMLIDIDLCAECGVLIPKANGADLRWVAGEIINPQAPDAILFEI